MSARLRRHWLATAITAVLAGLFVNAAADVGWWPLFILAAAVAGFCSVVACVMGVSGYSVVHHAKREAQAIEAVHGRKELTR